MSSPSRCSEFVYTELGLATAAAIHDGDPYTESLAVSFAISFEELGGTVTGFVGVAKEDTEMVPALTEVASGSPEALFFPIFQPAGDFIVDQAPGVAGLEGTQLIAADGLLVDATAMLLDAIDAASFVDDGVLMIDRAGVREYLDNLTEYEGMIGTINCDDFGDCGSQRITIVHHLYANEIEASKLNVVFEFAPEPR